MDSDKTVVERSSDDLIDILGKWGGAMAFFLSFGSYICTRFGEYNLFMIMAKELFEENDEHEEMLCKMNKTLDNDEKFHKDLVIPQSFMCAKCVVSRCWWFSCNKNRCRNCVYNK